MTDWPALPETIPEKKAMLLANGIALWDVIEECDIKGSSDSSIRNVQPADIGRILRPICGTGNIPAVFPIFLNGGTAGRLFHKYLEPKLAEDFPEIYFPSRVLPSTSPANARSSLDDLIRAWQPAADTLQQR